MSSSPTILTIRGWAASTSKGSDGDLSRPIASGCQTNPVREKSEWRTTDTPGKPAFCISTNLSDGPSAFHSSGASAMVQSARQTSIVACGDRLIFIGLVRLQNLLAREGVEHSERCTERNEGLKPFLASDRNVILHTWEAADVVPNPA